MTRPLHIAVLGDVHGHLTLAFRLLKRWERETGLRLDLALQVGDLGAFPPPFRLDKATRRFAERDPDELGFAQYFEPSPECDEVLGDDADPAKRFDAELVFIKGNHEDFAFLAAQSGGADGPVPVDCYQRILYLKSGLRWTFARGGTAITVGALGGIAREGGPVDDEPSEYYTRSELRRLRADGSAVDVLLTHEPPYDAAADANPKYRGQGSREALELIREIKPRFHFCGHYHEPGQSLSVPGETKSYLLNAVSFLKPNEINPGCIGILTWAGRESARFEWLAAPWLREYTRRNYREL